jgi:hypothetical protein
LAIYLCLDRNQRFEDGIALLVSQAPLMNGRSAEASDVIS